MERENQIWFFEVIRLEVRGAPPKVLERTLVRLSYLAPDITQAILDGRQPRDCGSQVRIRLAAGGKWISNPRSPV